MADVDWSKIQKRSPDAREPEVGRILPLWETPDKWSILQVGWWSVPDYDYDAACEGMSQDAIDRELNLSWLATVGKKVYPEFSRQLHIATEIDWDVNEPFHCGWDWGSCPAFVVTQLNAYGQWCILSEIAPREDQPVGIYDFACMAAEHLHRTYAAPEGLELDDLSLVHIGDPAGAAPPPRTANSPKETRSCFDILDYGVKVFLGRDDRDEPVYEERPGWGWRIIPGAIGITERLEAVRARLRRLIGDGLPAIVVDARCQTVIEGFGGAYCYKQRQDGRYELDPFKGRHSHVMDATSYIATRLDAQPPARDDDGGADKPEWRSMAASRSRG